MLVIKILGTETFDEETSTFDVREEIILELEHSLVSISKWESKWCKPFLKNEKKTKEEMFDYIISMIVKSSNPSFNLVYTDFSEDTIKIISDYINAPMTATTFSKSLPKSSNREIITSELIYYWMIAQQIPFECQYWHLNRLLTLINVCAIKNTPPKKMGRKELLSRNARLNEERRRQLNTTG